MGRNFSPGMKPRYSWHYGPADLSGAYERLQANKPPVRRVDKSHIQRMGDASNLRAGSIEASYRNLNDTTRQHYRKVAKRLYRTYGATGLRMLMRNAGIPGRVFRLVEILTEAAEAAAWAAQNPNQYQSERPMKTGDRPPFAGLWDGRFESVVQVDPVTGEFGMTYCDRDRTPPYSSTGYTIASNATPTVKWAGNSASGFVAFYPYATDWTTFTDRFGPVLLVPNGGVPTIVETLPYAAAFPQGGTRQKPNRGRYRAPQYMPLVAPKTADDLVFDIPPRGPGTVYKFPIRGLPPQRTRELKVNPKVGGIVGAIYWALRGTTEGLDFLDILYAASGGYDSERGLTDNPHWGFHERMRWLFEDGGISNLSWERLMAYAAFEFVQDRAIGRLNRATIKSLREAGYQRIVGPTSGIAL